MTAFDKIPIFSPVVNFATGMLLCKIYPLDTHGGRTSDAGLWKNGNEENRERNPKFLQKGVDFVWRTRYNVYLYEINGKGVPPMPNIKSSKKDVISSKIAYEKNKADKSELKTNLKKFDAALESADKTVAEAAYKVAVKAVDQAVIKGLLHKNNAARKKSSMTLKLNKLA